VRTPFDERSPAFSPDGHWIAYQSNESNRWEVYARPHPGNGGALLMSAGGGTAPVWSRDGRLLYYRGARGVMAVDVRAGCSAASESCDLAPSKPIEIVKGSWQPRGTTPQGRLLLERTGESEGADHLSVTLQWTRELQRLVPRAVVSSPK
jgi:hypothetical protein